eukprot:438512_1
MDIRWLLSVWALLSCRSAALIVGGLRRHLHRSHDRLGCSVGSRKVEILRVVSWMDTGYKGTRSMALAAAGRLPTSTARHYSANGGGADATRAAALKISLDTPIISRTFSPIIIILMAAVTSMFAIAITSRVLIFAEKASRAGYTLGCSLYRALMPYLIGIRYNLRLTQGSLRSFLDWVRDKWNKSPLGPPVSPLPIHDWSVATLHERERVGGSHGHHVRYRFRLPLPSSVMPLELGQEVDLCRMDGDYDVLYGRAPLLSQRGARGRLEVVASSPKGIDSLGMDGAVGLGRLLDGLALGDEVAIRPGRSPLHDSPPAGPVSEIVMIASGLGIVSMLSLAQDLLPAGESSVKAMNVIWLNEKEEDFSLYPELEDLYYRFHHKLDVNCIIEGDLYGNHLEANYEVTSAIPEYRSGILAAVSGPLFFVEKVREFLLKCGYPPRQIVSLL